MNTYEAFSRAFNAVDMSTVEVAETFVPSEAFERLSRAANAVLVGPRGAGKTTLLKMLQSEALEKWHSAEADQFARGVTSTGVFIPVDRLWNEQLKATPLPVQEVVARCAYGLHVAKALASAMSQRLGIDKSTRRSHLRAELPNDGERTLAVEFTRAFRLENAASSLSGVRILLERRLNDLGVVRERARYGAVDLPEWIFVDPITAASSLAQTFNLLAGEENHRWTLLVDELELAPPTLIRDLLSALRADRSILQFKLSIAPILEQADLFGGQHGAIEGHDFEFIELAAGSKVESIRFSRRILSAALSRANQSFAMTDKSVDELLGPSAFGEPNGTDSGGFESESSYESGGRVWEALLELNEVDQTFSNYLKRRDLTVSRLSEMNGSGRAASLRKMRNIVVTRAYYRGANRTRSRKSFELYSGAASMLSLADGNARMATALSHELVRHVSKHGMKRISPAAQGRMVEKVVARSRALTAAQSSVRMFGKPYTAIQLVDRVGEALASRVIRGNFSPDVVAGFTVDDKIPPEMSRLIERAVNAGALVAIDSSEVNTIRSTAAFEKYRISHSLAPHFHLPIRTGKAISLSTLLATKSADRQPLQTFVDNEDSDE